MGGLLVLGASGAAAQTAIFSSGITNALSGAPGDALPILVLADVGSFDGPLDGHLDLITADQSVSGQGAGTATVWYGNGDGTFTNNNGGIPLGRIPTALALGDFDGDGVPDLVVADASGNLVFLRGDIAGGTTFDSPGTPTPAGPSPVAVIAVDVNHDGDLDAVVVYSTEFVGGIAVLLGDGHGGFAAPKLIDLGPGGSGVVARDFNHDGDIDLAVSNGNTSSVVILHGDGAGNFTVGQTISENSDGRDPIAIVLGDVNKDGRPDLVVVNHGSDNVGVLLANADGTFQAPRLFSSGTEGSAPKGLVLLDANTDGNLDLGVVNNFSFDVSVLLGDGLGNFGAPRAFVTDQEALAVAAGDLNGDGIPDMVALNRDNTTPDAVTLIGQGDGSFIGVENAIVHPTPTMVVVGDVDNDGLSDLIVAHPTGEVLVRRSVAGRGFGPPLTLQAAGDAVAIGVGDLNADGRLDIVAVNQSPSNVSVFLGARNGFATPPQNYPVGAGAVAVAVGDWDGDGRADVAVARQVGGSPGVLDILMSGSDGSLQAPVSTSLMPAAPQFTVSVTGGTAGATSLTITGPVPAGFPTSGIIVGVTSGTTTTGVNIPYTRNGTVLTLSSPLTSAATSVTAISASSPLAIDWGDFNKDGKVDLALVNSASSEVTILLGHGDGTFQTPTSVALPPTVRGDARALAVADFDRNGFDDLAIVLPVDQEVIILYGNGQLAFTPAPPLHFPSTPWAVAARDITGDSIPDLLVVDQVANAVFPFINHGASKLFEAASRVAVSRSPIGIAAADFDGDGRYDAAAVDSNSAGTVSVMTNIDATPIIRGDANGDHKVTAADVVAMARKLAATATARVEQVTAPGADANGDGLVTAQDAFALEYRLFPRL